METNAKIFLKGYLRKDFGKLLVALNVVNRMHMITISRHRGTFSS